MMGADIDADPYRGSALHCCTARSCEGRTVAHRSRREPELARNLRRPHAWSGDNPAPSCRRKG
jgi:hypothetical protein